MRFTRALLVALALGLVVAAPAGAQLNNKTFYDTTNDHDWNTDGNWQPSGKPTSAHNAIIPSDKTCFIYTGGSDGVAGAFQVAGELTVQGQRKLTISHDSVVDGLVKLDNSGKLVIDENLTIRSNDTGVIRLQGLGEEVEDRAEIKNNGGNEVLTITNTCVDDEETCSVDIRGYGTVSLALANHGAVIADTFAEGDGIVLATNGKMGTGVWGAESGGVLKVEVLVTGEADWRIIKTNSFDTLSQILISVELSSGLCGDVYLEAGIFHAAESFCTNGHLIWKSASGSSGNTTPQIQVDSGAYTVARFSSDSCGCSS